MEFRGLDPEIALFPPLARVTTDAAVQLAAALGWQGFDWLIPALLLLYLVLRRKDGTLRLLGKVTLGAAAALLAAVLLSAWQAGRLFRYIQTLPWSCPSGISTGSSISSPSIWFWPARGSRPISWPGRSPGPGPRPGPCASAAS